MSKHHSFYDVDTLSTLHSCSLDVASSMLNHLWESFNIELLMKTVVVKLQPYACQYALEATYKMSNYDINLYDPRLDD